MRFQDLNWMDVERYLENDDRVLLVTGATEQHAYLSLLTDILISTRIADAVGQRTQVLVAPPLNFGISHYFREFPGTISLSKETFDRVILEVFESLFQQGFRKFFFLNGHGGNSMPERLYYFERAGSVRVIWHNWWQSPVAAQYAAEHSLKINHANWGENFSFNRVAESPTGVKRPVSLDKMQDYTQARDVLGDGSFGGPYQMDDEIMMGLFEAVVADVVQQINALKEN